jgi:hypothetical protein
MLPRPVRRTGERPVRSCSVGVRVIPSPFSVLIMRALLLLPLFVLFASPAGAQASSASDSAAVRQAALDYVEGWYEGNAERMQRSLHPDLVKRIPVRSERAGTLALQQLSAAELVAMTGGGGGRNTPEARRIARVEIKDIFGDIAMVRAEMSGWVDYMQLARAGDRWLIVNVLWQTNDGAARAGR